MKKKRFTVVWEYSKEPMSEAQKEEVLRLLAKIIAEAYLKDWRASQLNLAASPDVPAPSRVSSTTGRSGGRKPSKSVAR